MPPADSRLIIDLDAIAHNWRRLQAQVLPAECAAVVKADGYGLGAAAVARALARAGCRTFFVAHPAEGEALRQALPEGRIAVLHGVDRESALRCRAAGLIPCLSSLAQIEAWRAAGGGPAILHIDTGMARLGLPPAEVAALAAAPNLLQGVIVDLVMSHLACSEDASHPLNRRQLDAFAALRAQLPTAPASIANSGGCLLAPDYRLDLVRPGIALHGIDPRGPGQGFGLQPALRWQARILQIRDVEPPATVGYGATFAVGRPTRLATVALGYADGYPRALSNRAMAGLAGHRVPVVGRVSMDLLTVDVTAVPAAHAAPGAWLDLVGDLVSLDEVAASAGAIPYEILTRIGPRVQRLYTGAAA